MANVSSAAALPVVDLRDDPDELRQRLRSAAHRVGFFYLVGHGVPDGLVRGLLGAARRLFALPRADKDAIAMIHSPHFRGYTRLGGELTGGEIDWREQIDLGPERTPVDDANAPDYLRLQGPNQWPAALPELAGIVARWDAALSSVARTLLGHWAESLGARSDAFAAAFAELPATLIKIVRYPADVANTQGVGAHRDPGVLTLLLAEPGSPGLQVRRADDGEWTDVSGLGGAFIVNIGEMLEAATGGYLKATQHRVTLPDAAADRISVPYFFNPRLDAQIPVLRLPDSLGIARPGRPDPNDPIYLRYGANAWKTRLRAHPDVAAAHGYARRTAGPEQREASSQK